MKFISQFIIIIAFTFIGELLHFFIPLPIPASIYGIVLLFICLMMKWIKVTEIRETSTFPAAVGLIDSWAAIRSHILQYTIVTIVSTFAVMGTAGRITQRMVRSNKKKGENKTQG